MLCHKNSKLWSVWAERKETPLEHQQTAQNAPAETVSYVASSLLGNVASRRSWASQPQKHMAHPSGHSSTQMHIQKWSHMARGHTRTCTSLVFIPDSCHSFEHKSRQAGMENEKEQSEKDERRPSKQTEEKKEEKRQTLQLINEETIITLL